MKRTMRVLTILIVSCVVSPAKGNTRDEVFSAIQLTMPWLPHHAHIGILANIKAESGYKPHVFGDGGRAWGLTQTHPDRRNVIAGVMGEYPKDVIGQVAAIALEMLAHGEEKALDKLLESTTACGAAEAFSQYFERPRDKRVEMNKRCKIAEELERQINQEDV